MYACNTLYKVTQRKHFKKLLGCSLGCLLNGTDKQFLVCAGDILTDISNNLRKFKLRNLLGLRNYDIVYIPDSNITKVSKTSTFQNNMTIKTDICSPPIALSTSIDGLELAGSVGDDVN